jgi:hypothetical protein
VTARVDSIAISGYGTADTHCVYLVFASDGGYDPADGLNPSTIGAAVVIDNVLIEGGWPFFEDFTAFIPNFWISFLNMGDTTPFGAWARVFQHITDNDICSENPTCAWLATDHTTPTFANDPSMAFGPDQYVIRNWNDEIATGPWVSLASTPSAIATLIQFRRFPGNFFSTARGVQNWSIQGRSRISNMDSLVPGDFLDCVSGWGHAT